MREELAKQGIPKDTDEIRESYNFPHHKVNITSIPPNETQFPHKHYLVEETDHLVSGSMQVYSNGKWYALTERQAVVFQLGEYHNVRATGISKPVSYPHATANIAAVFFTYKVIPPYLDVKPDEIDLVISNDFFHEDYINDPTNIKTSPILRADEKTRNKFWEIVNRNKHVLKDYHPELAK